METQNSGTKIDTFERIVNSLLLNASFINNLGLLNGKMGISIFFFHLARQTQNKIYEDYAGELIDEIYEEISPNTPTDFENGLAGIGWGIEYLFQNRFISVDIDETLEEFDIEIFKEIIYNTPLELNLLNGILGIGAYFLKRIQNRNVNDKSIYILTNHHTLVFLIDELDRRTQDIDKIISEPLQPSSNQYDKSKIELQRTTNEKFDLIWDYTTLLWFLAEYYQKKINSHKIIKIVQRIIHPLHEDCNYPKLQSNRLILALVLIKLQQEMDKQTVSSLGIDLISTSLLKGINRKTIKSELPPNNMTLRYGVSGIALIFSQLYCLTGEYHFEQEMKYWFRLLLLDENINDILRNAKVENSIDLGMAKNLASIIMLLRKRHTTAEEIYYNKQKINLNYK